MTSPRIAISGAGAIAAAGRSPQEIWDAIRAGRSAISTVEQWESGRWPNARAGEIGDFDARALVPDRKVHKLLRRTDFFGLFAAARAVDTSPIPSERAGLTGPDAERFDDRSAVYVASGGGAFQNQYEFLPPLATSEGDLVRFAAAALADVPPLWLLRSLPNNVLCHVGIRHGFKGPNTCLTSHSVGGVLAIGEAFETLRAGEADRALAIAHESPIEPEMVRHYDGVGLLSPTELRPFDRRHDGSLLGEGAAALVLEASDAPMLGELLAVATATEGDGLLPIRADGDGLVRAIEQALAAAGIDGREVGMIVAHGNGTPASDDSEAAAIRSVFGDDSPPVTAFKWAIGHLLAASALVDVTLALVSLRRGVVPGIATLGEVAEPCGGIALSAREQTPRSDVALVLSRGFAGTNGAVVVRASRAEGA